ncbi:MAG: hypothetical protein FK733_03235 [Asgard group archaeon]|nr:hypothetical protein [Asgard group archaeon]
MKSKNLAEKITLFLIIICSSITLNLILINEYPAIFSIQNVDGATNPFIADFSFDSSPTSNLFLVYREQLLDYNKLQILSADSDYQWNFTTDTITQENDSFILQSTPSLQAGSSKLWIVSSYMQSTDMGIILYSKNYSENEWNSSIILKNQAISYLNPKIVLDKTNDTLWLCWKDSHEISINLYYMTYNLTSHSWSSNYTINTINGLNCSNYDFILDGSGNAHFIWTQGIKPSNQIYFRTVMSNGTMSSVEILTDGTTNCISPTLVVDSNYYLNAIWENQTVENPEDEYGTINIQSSRKSIANGTWSKSIEIAPYIPVDRPPSSRSDASHPTAAMDATDNIWLAYIIREDYAYHQGVDIRNRNGPDWKPSVKLSLVNNLAIQPKVKSDQAGNLHCLWLDLRTGSYVIYYRVKFANNQWSDEILLTRFSNRTGDMLKFALIAIGVIAVMTIPSFILARALRKREERKLKRKIDLLQ